MTHRLPTLGVLVALAVLAGCAKSATHDTFIEGGALADMRATVWVDPDGCKHWVIDDGVEGYMSPVLNPDGSPDCV